MEIIRLQILLSLFFFFSIATLLSLCGANVNYNMNSLDGWFKLDIFLLNMSIFSIKKYWFIDAFKLLPPQFFLKNEFYYYKLLKSIKHYVISSRITKFVTSLHHTFNLNH